MRLPWCLLILGIFGACSDREHSNPFDPDNPQTGGHPLLLWAIPAERYVRLHWSVPGVPDLEAPTLLRIAEGQPADTLVREIPLSGAYVDREPALGTLRYVLEARVEGWSGIHRSDSSLAVTSTGDCWIASGYDRLSLLSARTTSLLPSVSPGTFIVDVSAAATTLWAAGMPGGVVYGFEASSAGPFLTEDVTTSLSIRAISASRITTRILLAHSEGLSWFDPDRHTLEEWQLDNAAAPVLARLSPDEAGAWVWFSNDSLAYLAPGSPSPVVVGSLEDISDLSPACDRCCWIGCAGGLYRGDENGILRVLDSPVSAVAGALPEWCWACLTDGSVIVVASDGVILHASRPMGAYRVCASSEEAVVWVACSDTTLWKLSPGLQPWAHLRLFELPWAIVPGPLSFQ